MFSDLTFIFSGLQLLQIRYDYEKERLICDDPPSAKSEERVYDEKEEDLEEGEATRVPPNSPDDTMKVGPPARTDQRARCRYLPSRIPVPTNERGVGCDGIPRDEMRVEVRREEDEDTPYQMGLLSRGPSSRTNAPPPLEANPLLLTPPPDLTYPEDHFHSYPTYHKKMFKLPSPSSLDDDDPPPPLIPASPKVVIKRGCPSNVVLQDILLCLFKLRYELGIAFDCDTLGMIEKMEKCTNQLIMTNQVKGRGDGVRDRIRDEDGDVRMKEKGRAMSENPTLHPTLPGEYSLSPESLSRFDDLLNCVQTIHGMIMSYQWKKVDDQKELEESVALLHSQVSSLEVCRTEEEAAMVTRRRSYRETQERPLARGVTHKLENKIDQAAKEIHNL